MNPEEEPDERDYALLAKIARALSSRISRAVLIAIFAYVLLLAQSHLQTGFVAIAATISAFSILNITRVLVPACFGLLFVLMVFSPPTLKALAALLRATV